MEMGKRIRDLRIQKGMTQEELGRVIGVQKSAIRKYESGAVENIKRSSIDKMAQLFGVTPSFLMGWDENIVREAGQAVDDYNAALAETKDWDPKSKALLALLTDEKLKNVNNRLSEEDIEFFNLYNRAKKANGIAVKALVKALEEVVKLDEQGDGEKH